MDLNADLGEEITDDDGLLAVVTSANLACGYHAGNREIMRRVCAAAAVRGVRVGAQVSYDDRAHFGRVELDVPAHTLGEQIADQVGTLAAIALTEGAEVGYLKPHGALYHRTREDAEQADAVLSAATVDGRRLPILGMSGALRSRAEAAGHRVVAEGFPDRAYDGDRLRARGRPGAVLTEEDAIVRQALDLASGVASLCLHGDTPGAVGHAGAVRRGLEAAGWQIAPFT